MIAPSNSQIYVGLMSGTSMDAVDVAGVSFNGSTFKLLGTHSESFPTPLRQSLHDLCQPGIDEINKLGQLDRQVGFLFASGCNNLLKKLGLNRKDVVAIGSHGQTIRHQPSFEFPFTLQIGDPNVIAEITGITTIADFRRRDMVCGGQGAPLTPAFHHFAFHSPHSNRVVVNLGGIANLTFLPANHSTVKGFDCGPGNTLLDNWIRFHLDKPYDLNGEWAKKGNVNEALLNHLLTDPYFHAPAPKSTGKEYFNLRWIQEKIGTSSIQPEDVQATLSTLTARTISDAIELFCDNACEILLCGGGVHNKDLMQRLKKIASKHQLYSTNEFGVDPDWVEAIAFAWLARQTINRLPGNLPDVTGAASATILGGIYQAVSI